MTTSSKARALVDGAIIDPSVFTLRPDYRAVLISATGIVPSPSDSASEQLLTEAETFARSNGTPLTQRPHIATWREAYKAFGAKPAKYRNSLEALSRRIGPGTGLPRINKLTDIYNAVSVRYQIPLGGEDAAKYVGLPRLIRATGKETFHVKSGESIIVEHPEAGEVCWVDDEGVTCRRWNWRQDPRTALTDQTTEAFFICDALSAMSDSDLAAAVDELMKHLKGLGPDVVIHQRTLRAPLA
ncbi:uncharacterized protein AB675_2300 [Cyphellophora attinorum]|uniref:B3/B4 tRNA-binding domain-containing protein n=1 Tax=Cyphellophora attinorum TaxID=1664694 RepID=A0A0N1P2B8_9EURO|nr:uncharacterized protein AB675_2300 [Phialophora attinorum]KPI45012.1 hypothetical protein AB675_2300 [Phialophora attinorum]